MNSSPRPYLNVTRPQSTQRGISTTSSCSTLTHSTGPMPSGKSNISGSENGARREPAALALPDQRRVQALLDRRPDRERRRERRSRRRRGRRRRARRSRRSRRTGGRRRSGRRRRRARARRPCRRARAGPRASQSSSSANCASPSITPGLLVRVARGAARTASSPCRGRCTPAASAASKIGGFRRGSQALRITSARSASRPARRSRAASRRVAARRRDARVVAERGGRGLRALAVDVGERRCARRSRGGGRSRRPRRRPRRRRRRGSARGERYPREAKGMKVRPT